MWTLVSSLLSDQWMAMVKPDYTEYLFLSVFSILKFFFNKKYSSNLVKNMKWVDRKFIFGCSIALVCVGCNATTRINSIFTRRFHLAFLYKGFQLFSLHEYRPSLIIPLIMVYLQFANIFQQLREYQIGIKLFRYIENTLLISLIYKHWTFLF